MMKKTEIDKLSDKLVKAFLKNKIIAPLPLKYTKKINSAINNLGFANIILATGSSQFLFIEAMKKICPEAWEDKK